MPRRERSCEAGTPGRDSDKAGLSARNILRSLSSGLFAYLAMCGEIGTNPVPRGPATRRPGRRGMARVRTPMLPEILAPAEVDAPLGDRGHGSGGLRPGELGLRIGDLGPGGGWVFVAKVKSGRHASCPSPAPFLRSE